MDASAGAGDGVLVVADGMGGHCTGWLSARLATRTIVERLAPRGAFIGAANGFPDDWGWAGAMQSRATAERVYDEIAGDLGDRAALPRDLTELFLVIDKVVGNIRAHFPTDDQVGCIAATIEGSRVRGVHAGIGRVLVLRAGATEVENIVVEHFMHLVAHRMRAKLPADFDPAAMPQQITVNALGCLEYSGVGIDPFEIDLAPGDLLVLSSRRLDITDRDLVELARTTPAARDLARAIERRAATAYPAPDEWRASDVAFALLRMTPHD